MRGRRSRALRVVALRECATYHVSAATAISTASPARRGVEVVGAAANTEGQRCAFEPGGRCQISMDPAAAASSAMLADDPLRIRPVTFWRSGRPGSWGPPWRATTATVAGSTQSVSTRSRVAGGAALGCPKVNLQVLAGNRRRPGLLA